MREEETLPESGQAELIADSILQELRDKNVDKEVGICALIYTLSIIWVGDEREFEELIDGITTAYRETKKGFKPYDG